MDATSPMSKSTEVRSEPHRRILKPSCNRCRSVKVKCDRREPECGRCSKVGTTCTYDSSRRTYGRKLAGLPSKIQSHQSYYEEHQQEPRPDSRASSYGSTDTGISHPPRVGSKKKEIMNLTYSEFYNQSNEDITNSSPSSHVESWLSDIHSSMALHKAETRSLIPENQILRMRIKELESHCSDLNISCHTIPSPITESDFHSIPKPKGEQERSVTVLDRSDSFG